MTMLICLCVVALALVGVEAGPVDTKDHNKLSDVKATLAIEDHVVNFYDSSKCLEKMMCVIAALPDSEFNKYSNNPLSILVKIATDEGIDIDSPLYLEAKELLVKYPNIRKLISAAETGHSSKNDDCSAMYSECPTASAEILELTKDFGDVSKLITKTPIAQVLANFIVSPDMSTLGKREKRSCDEEALEIACGTLSGSCATGGIGCAICAIFTFGTCAAACAGPVALVCTSIGAGCGIGATACLNDKE